MRNLISANLLRLGKSKSFGICLAIMAATGVAEVIFSYAVMQEYNTPISLDSRYIIFLPLAAILSSAFCALFVGAEYSDGTIRRKIAAGYGRTVIYLSNLVLCIGASILLCLGYIVTVFAVGIPFLGFLQASVADTLYFTLYAFLMMAALCSIFTVLVMLYQNKAVSAVLCIFLAYFLVFIGIFLFSRLSEPEFYDAYEYIQNGQILQAPRSANPYYVRGLKRILYQILCALPGCQTVSLISDFGHTIPYHFPCTSLVVLLLSTGIGLLFFGKKDIK